MTLLAELVGTSRQVAETASRNAKTALLADCLRKLAPAEIEAAIAYLSGETRQGRSGIGYADDPNIPSLRTRKEGRGEGHVPCSYLR